MSVCNHCTLKAITQRARREGKRVVRRPENFGLGGVAVHVLESGEQVDVNEESTTRVAWFMELTEGCVC